MLSSAIRAASRRSITASARASSASISSSCCSHQPSSTIGITARGSNQWNSTHQFRQYTIPTSTLAMPVKTIDVPTMGDSITEGTIVDIPVGPGDFVLEDDVVLVLETDKVSVDVRAPEAGKMLEILGEVDDVVDVGSGLYRLDTDAEAPAGAPAKEEAPAAAAAPEPVAAAPTPPPQAAPVAAAPAPPKAAAPAAPSLPVIESVTTSLGNRPERRSKMSRMR